MEHTPVWSTMRNDCSSSSRFRLNSHSNSIRLIRGDAKETRWGLCSQLDRILEAWPRVGQATHGRESGCSGSGGNRRPLAAATNQVCCGSRVSMTLTACAAAGAAHDRWRPEASRKGASSPVVSSSARDLCPAPFAPMGRKSNYWPASSALNANDQSGGRWPAETEAPLIRPARPRLTWRPLNFLLAPDELSIPAAGEQYRPPTSTSSSFPWPSRGQSSTVSCTTRRRPSSLFCFLARGPEYLAAAPARAEHAKQKRMTDDHGRLIRDIIHFIRRGHPWRRGAMARLALAAA